jgi:hypothetical protein
MNTNELPTDLEELKELILSGNLSDEQLNSLIENHCHAYLLLEDDESCELCEYMAEGEDEEGFRLMEELINSYKDRFTDAQIGKFAGPEDTVWDEWFAEDYMGADGWRESRARGAELMIELRTSKNAGYQSAKMAFYSSFLYLLEQGLFESWNGDTPRDQAKKLLVHMATFPACSAADVKDSVESFHGHYTSGCEEDFDACAACQELIGEVSSQLN